ncbi:phosphate-repressible phosphate permease [Cladophialophora psammophila CBS 110553]|uniref:Phosphate transporter n=1 Tax=Cladophialophora psammophila CBS 110553 TaxID=1182543 RepID=W9X2D4_9EURO|nr:phosphate-repressible phosphate permease [Cladophialophora psammophila CBS 110553]EXJ74637.1 phosphate-repressible phosphate permease [Cladophialophora psammophila CBS 110553]
MALHQFDYIFAIGTIFAFLDAWNIGANDVANSFATSVSSRSLTHLQAMMIASVMEFAGSMGVGARVADTIRTKIIDVDRFEENPALLMLGMACAVVASSTYLTVATKLGMPVSTTHSIMGGVIGMGIALVGADGVIWWGGDVNSGVVQVFLAWVLAPLIAGSFGSIIFLITKFGVMQGRNPLMRALASIPIYFGITSALLTMLIVWKGGSSRISISDSETVGIIIGVGAAVAAIMATFFLPWLYRKLWKNDWELKYYHIIEGPLLLWRAEPPPAPEGYSAVRDYYEGHKTMEELEAHRADGSLQDKSEDPEHNGELDKGNGITTSGEKGSSSRDITPQSSSETQHIKIVGPRPEGKNTHPRVLFWHFKRYFFRGIEKDVVALQSKRNILSGDLDLMHARATHYDNKAEYLYSFLQVMTAATASFTHGANDVSNAIGPYASIYYIWSTAQLKSKSPVPYWILAFGGAAIVIGLWTYGYNIMRNLGNRITLHSPSRGFSMELGSAITVIMATKLKLPISTTQCISGATVGVGLCSGTWRTINWRMVAWIYFGWIITLPVTGIISGCIAGIIINAPRWGLSL